MVLGLDKVGKGLGLLPSVVVVVVIVAVAVILGSDVLHLVNAAALGAPLDGAVAGDLAEKSVYFTPSQITFPRRKGRHEPSAR